MAGKILKRLCLCLGLILCQPHLGLAVNEAVLNDSRDNIQKHFQNGIGSTFLALDGYRIGYWHLPGEGRPIVIITGLGETYEHYAELIYDLRGLKRTIFVIELRGQGHGDRLSTSSEQVIHVEDFNSYALDFDQFMSYNINANETIDLIAHSTGAYAAISYASRMPARVNQLILSSPLLQVELGYYPEWLVSPMTRFLCLLGMGGRYVPTSSDFSGIMPGLHEFRLTHSSIRFEEMFRIIIEDADLQTGGPSNAWLRAALKITAPLAAMASSLNVNTLLLTADDDQFVSTKEQSRFCNLAPHCRQIKFKNSYHVLLQESDEIRDRVLGHLLTALSSN